MKYFWPVATLICMAIIILMRSCTGGHGEPPSPVVKFDTVILHVTDTIIKETLIPVEKIVNHTPAPITVTDTIFLTEVEKVDTLAILKDYFTTRKYSDTNHLEGYGNIIINDAITQNKIKNREIQYNLNIPQVTKTVIQKRNQWFGGIDIGGTKQWISFGPDLELINKKDQAYHIGVSFTTENQYYFHLGTSWKIKF
jgi:hypothetical protein